MAIARPILLLLPLLCAACASTLPDEMARTIEATREANVRGMVALADSAERLPATFDRVNALLARADEASADVRAAQQGLTVQVAEVTSSTAVAIARMADLVGTLDRAAGKLDGLLRRLDAISVGWEERAPQLREDEARAMHALAGLAESSARTGEQVAALSESATRLAVRLEPEVEASTRTTTRLLEDVQRLTARLASDEVATGALAVNALAGALGAGVVVALALLVRLLFRRAVEREVAARVRS